MTALLIRHCAGDALSLATAMDRDRDTRGAYGGRGCEVFRNMVDPRDVMIDLEWDDPGRARLFADSDDVRQMRTEAGAVGPPDLWILDNDSG